MGGGEGGSDRQPPCGFTIHMCRDVSKSVRALFTHILHGDFQLIWRPLFPCRDLTSPGSHSSSPWLNPATGSRRSLASCRRSIMGECQNFKFSLFASLEVSVHLFRGQQTRRVWFVSNFERDEEALSCCSNVIVAHATLLQKCVTYIYKHVHREPPTLWTM